jgi:hypothetical protein
MFKSLKKSIKISFCLLNKGIPNAILTELVFLGFKELAKRTSTPFDNEIGKIFIEKSNLSKEEKENKIKELDGKI